MTPMAQNKAVPRVTMMEKITKIADSLPIGLQEVQKTQAQVAKYIQTFTEMQADLQKNQPSVRAFRLTEPQVKRILRESRRVRPELLFGSDFSRLQRYINGDSWLPRSFLASEVAVRGVSNSSYRL